jgi:3-oxoadipate enol-lactonase
VTGTHDRRALDASSPDPAGLQVIPTATAFLGRRESALADLAAVIASGGSHEALNASFADALDAEATFEEILGVVDQVAQHGIDAAVEPVLAMTALLADERQRQLPGTTESVLRIGDHDTLVWDNDGAGVPMLLLHSLGLDRRVWRGVYPRLGHVGRVIAYDLRGHGFARGALSIRSVSQLAEDAVRLLDKLDIAVADVYGASFGGAITQQLTLDHPERVRSQAIIASASWGRQDALDLRATAAEENGMEAQVAETMMRWFSPAAIAKDGWAVRYARDCLRRDRVEDWASAWRAMARFHVVNRLPEIAVPTLAVAGAQDVSAVPAAVEITAQGIPLCSYTIIDPGTHMLVLEQADALATTLVRFRHEVDEACFP